MAKDFDWNLTNDRAFHSRLHIPNKTDREDAIQDAALKLLSKARAATPELLHTTTVNCHKDRVKTESRRKERERAYSTSKQPARYPRFARDPDHHSDPIVNEQRPPESIASNPDPSERLVKHETRAEIKRVIREARLSRDYRCALWAWCRDRLQEFGARRHIPPPTARVWVHRALKSLEPHFISQGFGPL